LKQFLRFMSKGRIFSFNIIDFISAIIFLVLLSFGHPYWGTSVMLVSLAVSTALQVRGEK